MRDTELKERLSSFLHLSPEDLELVWTALEEAGYIGDFHAVATAGIEREREAWHALVRAARAKCGSLGVKPLPKADTGERRLRQAQARAQAVLADARQQPEVATFRAEHLAEGPIAPIMVEQWVKQVHSADGAGAPEITYTPQSGSPSPQRQPDGSWQYPPGGPPRLTVRELPYLTTGPSHVRHTPIRSGGTLDHLRDVAESLAPIYQWSLAQAVWFVLTDTDPGVVSVRITAGGVVVRGSEDAYLEPMRIEFYPDTTKDEITAAVEQARALSGLPRLRFQEPKALLLARLRSAHPDVDGDDSRALRDAWNEWVVAEAPDWAYRSDAHDDFCRDLKKAEGRLLNRARLRDLPPGPGDLGDGADAST